MKREVLLSGYDNTRASLAKTNESILNAIVSNQPTWNKGKPIMAVIDTAAYGEIKVPCLIIERCNISYMNQLRKHIRMSAYDLVSGVIICINFMGEAESVIDADGCQLIDRFKGFSD